MATAVRRSPVPARARSASAPAREKRPVTRAPARSRPAKPALAPVAKRAVKPVVGTYPRRATAPARAHRGHGRALAIAAVGTVCALVFAVVSHVILAERQLQLDHLSGKIADAQQTYEKRQLQLARLSTP